MVIQKRKLNNKNKIFPWIGMARTYLLFAYAFILPIHYKTSIKVLIVLLVLSIFSLPKKSLIIRSLAPYWAPFLFLILLVIGVFYSEDGSKAAKIVFDAALIPAFALVALANSPIPIRKVLLAFTAGTLTASLTYLFYAIYRDITEGAYWAYYHLVFTDILSSHPIYMGYFVNFSIAIVFYYGIDFETRWKGKMSFFLSLIVIFFLILIHVFLSDRMPVAAVLTCSLVWIFMYSRSFKVHAWFALMLVVLGTTIVFTLKERTIIIDRFLDLIVPQNSLTDTEYGGYVERFSLWKAGINSCDNIVFGVGTGDGQQSLNGYYKRYNYGETFIIESYNSHSQYVQIFLTNGLIGLACLLTVIIQPVLWAIRAKSFLNFMFFAPFLFYGISEVFYGRYQGIAFYFFFYFLLSFYERSTTSGVEDQHS